MTQLLTPPAPSKVDASSAPAGRTPASENLRTAAGYGMALLFLAVSLAISLFLQRFFPYPFLFLFFAAVMAAAWVGGLGPGIFAVFVSTLAIDYYFVPPLHSLAINATESTYFAAFVVCALVASWVSAAKKDDEQALREARDQLEVRVAKRTEELQKTNAALEMSIAQSEKTQQALIATQADLARLARFLTMGELTASIAHEVNQPLTAIVTNGSACLEWLSAPTPAVAEARQAAETIVKDGTRAAAVLGRIRALFRNQSPTKEWLDMNAAIQELVALLHHEFVRHRIVCRMELSPGLRRVRGDRVQLQQVLLNLMMNAIDAMRDGEPLKYKPAEASAAREIVIRSRNEDAHAILVEVEDSGSGINPAIREKVFEPLFTTKPEGIGMGLAIARSIAESHGGRLRASARSAGGTILELTIPAGA